VEPEEIWMDLRALRRHGWSVSALAREFHLNRRTVNRELAAEVPRRYPLRAPGCGWAAPAWPAPASTGPSGGPEVLANFGPLVPDEGIVIGPPSNLGVLYCARDQGGWWRSPP
jgi:hypothetical protein